MDKVMIVTDSNCDIPSSLLKDNIKVIPVNIVMSNGETYSVDKFNNKTFCQYLELGVNAKNITLVPKNVDSVLSSIEDNTDIILIHSSGNINPSIEIVLEECVNYYCLNHINSRVCVIDSKTTSMALGLLVLDAATMAENNIPFEDIIKYVGRNRLDYRCEFISDNSEVLKDHKVISSRRLQVAAKKHKEYIYGLTREGLIRPIDKVDDFERENVLIRRLQENSDGRYAVISSRLSKRDITHYRNTLGEELIDSEISCGNLSIMGAKTVGLCYKKK